MDILPTVLDLAGVEHPGTSFHGKTVEAMSGKSWTRYMQGEADSIHDENTITGWEFIGRQALRKGSYKIVRLPPPWGTGEWEMYNLAEDQAENFDLRGQQPEKFAEMLGYWEDYAKKNGVVEIKSVEKMYALQEEEWDVDELEQLV